MSFCSVSSYRADICSTCMGGEGGELRVGGREAREAREAREVRRGR
jgi:hypothetical protein